MAGTRKIRRAEWRGGKHKIPIHSFIGKRGNQFEVCVMVGITFGGKMIHACGLASNPRAALSAAFRRAGADTAKRSGTFARYRR